MWKAIGIKNEKNQPIEKQKTFTKFLITQKSSPRENKKINIKSNQTINEGGSSYVSSRQHIIHQKSSMKSFSKQQKKQQKRFYDESHNKLNVTSTKSFKICDCNKQILILNRALANDKQRYLFLQKQISHMKKRLEKSEKIYFLFQIKIEEIKNHYQSLTSYIQQQFFKFTEQLQRLIKLTTLQKIQTFEIEKIQYQHETLDFSLGKQPDYLKINEHASINDHKKYQTLGYPLNIFQKIKRNINDMNEIRTQYCSFLDQKHQTKYPEYFRSNNQ